MNPQGHRYPKEIRERIAKLLRIEDLQMPTIAKRFGCSVAFVRSVNEEYGIRQYGSNRNKFTIEAA